VAVACGVAFVLGREKGFEEARLRVRWLTGGWRVLAKVPLDIVLVCSEALAQLVRPRSRRGSFRAVAFDAVVESPEDTGRRALAEALGSVAPNTIVLGVDVESGLLLVHQLRRQGDARDLDVMRLG
jgi:hypothetical protein